MSSAYNDNFFSSLPISNFFFPCLITVASFLIKFIGACTAKETINKMKRQPSDWEKIFGNNVTDKTLNSKICEQLIQFNNKKDDAVNMLHSLYQ